MNIAPRDTSGGFVLIAVLAVMALLSAMLVVMFLSTRSAIETAVIADERVDADALVTAGLEMAGFQLFVQKKPSYLVDGQELVLNAGKVHLSISSESGKVDLNGSGAELLASAYRASGLTSLTPQSFAGRVLDWRDGDADPVIDGAEVDSYVSAGAAFGPRNGAFRSVGDLAWVLGVSGADVAILAPYVTIFNPRGLIDAKFVSEELLAALPGADRQTVAAVLRMRREHPEDTVGSIELLGGQAKLLEAEGPRSYSIRMRVVPARGSVRQIDLVMIASVDRGAPYQIVSWENR